MVSSRPMAHPSPAQYNALVVLRMMLSMPAQNSGLPGGRLTPNPLGSGPAPKSISAAPPSGNDKLHDRGLRTETNLPIASETNPIGSAVAFPLSKQVKKMSKLTGYCPDETKNARGWLP